MLWIIPGLVALIAVVTLASTGLSLYREVQALTGLARRAGERIAPATEALGRLHPAAGPALPQNTVPPEAPDAWVPVAVGGPVPPDAPMAPATRVERPLGARHRRR